jgi:GT2 family glycosyltransferase
MERCKGTSLSSVTQTHPVTGSERAELARISAIIPTKNRPDDLRLTVRTLLEQILLPSQVIIVDQSEDEKSKQATEEEFARAKQAAKAVPELRYVHDSNIRGVSAARNRGIAEAQGTIWLFLDDDVLMERDFTRELLQVYSSHGDVDGVSGIITNYLPLPLLYRIWLSIFARGPFQEKRLPLYWKASELPSDKLYTVIGFTGALMSFRAEAARNATFDIRVRDGEDVDYCLSMGKGRKFVVAPRVQLKHMRSPTGRVTESWVGKFAASQSFLYHKHWRDSLKSRICYGWLILGLLVAAGISAIRRFSLAPIQDGLNGLKMGQRTAETQS